MIVACLGFVFARDGWSDEGLRAAIRVTARSSFLLFLGAFSASSLATFLPSAPTRWLLANRRYVGISFALSHLMHAAAIVTLAVRTGGGSLSARMAGLIGGGIVYGLIIFMLATSFDRTAAWVGAAGVEDGAHRRRLPDLRDFPRQLRPAGGGVADLSAPGADAGGGAGSQDRANLWKR